MPDGNLHAACCGRHMRTRAFPAPLAAEMAALRHAGVTVRGIAVCLGASPSGVHGLLARLGLAGTRPPLSGKRVVLSRRAAEAVALLVHLRARRLTWRQRAVLQGRVRGMATEAIARDLGIRQGGVRSLLATARRRLERPWRRRSRARRLPPADLTAWEALPW